MTPLLMLGLVACLLLVPLDNRTWAAEAADAANPLSEEETRVIQAVIDRVEQECRKETVYMIGPAKATLYSYVEPLFTMFAAFVFLGELLAPLQIVGALIVVGALTAAGLAGLRQR